MFRFPAKPGIGRFLYPSKLDLSWPQTCNQYRFAFRYRSKKMEFCDETVVIRLILFPHPYSWHKETGIILENASRKPGLYPPVSKTCAQSIPTRVHKNNGSPSPGDLNLLLLLPGIFSFLLSPPACVLDPALFNSKRCSL